MTEKDSKPILSNFYGEDLKSVGSNFPMDLFGIALDSLERKITFLLRGESALDKDQLTNIWEDYTFGKYLQLDHSKGTLSELQIGTIPSTFNRLMKHNATLGGPFPDNR